ncbi:hypothetical protein [Paraburkholderia sp. GAS334]|jgi:hypothetical protein|uniref:hypothetical protein n=1 Tax=Paraburkholderia sp. GAS334 TaxID=3035131 RepID=UPI003D1BF2F6
MLIRKNGAHQSPDQRQFATGSAIASASPDGVCMCLDETARLERKASGSVQESRPGWWAKKES